jgi:hypothetical protein
MSGEIILQDILDEQVNALLVPLNATIATQTATIAADATALAAKDTQISALQAELATFHPVPDLHNTGFRGGLTAGGASVLTAAHDQTISNKQISYPASFSGANVTLSNDKVYPPTAAPTLDGSAATGFVMIDTTIVGAFKGSGTFTKSAATALELTAASTVKDCYFPGGITGSGVAASTITNTTVTVLP